MADLKNVIKSTQEQTPNLEKGMIFRKIISATFAETQYKKADGSKQQVAVIVVDKVGDGKTEKYHTTAGAIVQLLQDYFVKDKNTEPLENAKVDEIRSKQGRMYLSLVSSIQ